MRLKKVRLAPPVAASAREALAALGGSAYIIKMLKLDRIVRRLRAWEKLVGKAAPYTSFAALSVTPQDHLIPRLDRRHINERDLSPLQRDWRRHGVLRIPGCVPEALLSAYEAVHSRCAPGQGWDCPVPYMHLREVRDVCLYRPLTDVLEHLLGEPLALYRNVTRWDSGAQGCWQQDDYLSPQSVNTWCVGAWIVLQDQQADNGAFEYIPHSHRWPVLRGDRVRGLLSQTEAGHAEWERYARPWVSNVYRGEIERRCLKPEQLPAQRGDVLIWHGRLVHRELPPQDLTQPRSNLAGYFSAISKRPDLPEVAWTRDGAAFFVRENLPLDRPQQRAG